MQCAIDRASQRRGARVRIESSLVAVPRHPVIDGDDVFIDLALVGDARSHEIAARRRTRRPDRPAARGGGSAGRAAAGLLRIGNTVSAAVTNKRKLEPVETRIMLAVALVLVIVGVLVAIFPRLIAYPMAAVAIWIAAALLYRTYRLRRKASSP